jgi:hypothetical protein
LQGDDACLGVTEDAPNDGYGAEAGEPVRVWQAHDFSHSEIMPSFLAPGKDKNHGKIAARDTIIAAGYPHALEKSRTFFAAYIAPAIGPT